MELASEVLPAATSLVSLVEPDRQWFAARYDRARAVPGPPAQETPLSHSFCQWAVTSSSPLVVEDSHEHPVLRHNRAVADGVTAYAGMPLVVEGQTLGTVCVVDYEPRVWDEDDLNVLGLLATVTASEIRLRLPEPRPRVTDVADACSAAIGSLTRLGRTLGPMSESSNSHVMALIDRFNERIATLGAPERN
ncbi:MAG: GAF domain-containing protein [Actinomycetota bacterium]|nr:GAF domain-containing protein [Actinomycetota bacterium]